MAFGRTYNSSNVDTNAGRIFIPAGDYDVKIVNVEDKVSKTSGRDMIELEVKVISGQCKGGKLYYYITDDQYADQKIWAVLTSCGEKIPPQITSNTFRGGLTGRVRVKVETYQGENRSQIHYWLQAENKTEKKTETETETDDLPF